MERYSYKVLVVMSLLVVVILGSSESVGGGNRKMMMNEKNGEEVVEPENYRGSYTGTLPGPITGTFQSPGYTLDFPTPGFGTGISLPNPGSGSGSTPGSSNFCGFPGVTCAPPTPVRPTTMAPPLGGGSGSGYP